MMNIILGIIFVILGAIFTIWPRSLWWWRYGWLSDREPTCVSLWLYRLTGVIMTVMGFTLILIEFL